jgi:hypothetical protein
MATVSLRLPDDVLARLDAWAGARGGRAPALRQLIDATLGAPAPVSAPAAGRLPPRPLKLTVRLAAGDGAGLAEEARAMGLTPSAWAAALVRQRLTGGPTFRREDELALVAIQAEYRRIGVNVNQIARALNTAVLEGRVLDLELAWLEELRTELRVHMSTLRAAFDGATTYWTGEL